MSYMITKNVLQNLYVSQGKSMKVISVELNCSENKVCYWLQRYGISRRTISEAVYLKNNPQGDPFIFRKPKTKEETYLYGLGLGLYWGEGNKANKSAVRLGNTDPRLIEMFIKFLETIFTINRVDLHFSLQIFSDIAEKEALEFWVNELHVSSSQFYKTTITPYRSIGNYRQKTKYGVVIVYYHNKKLRDCLNDLLQYEIEKRCTDSFVPL